MKTLTHKLGAAVAALLLTGAAAAQSIAPPTGMPLNPIPPFDADMENKRQDMLDDDCEITHLVRKDETDSVRYFLQLHPLISNRPDTVDFDINCADERGRTALYFAAARNNAEVVRMLLSGEFAALAPLPNLETTDLSRTALFIAVLKGHTDAVRAFTEADTKPDFSIGGLLEEGGTLTSPVRVALQEHHFDIAVLLNGEEVAFPAPEKTLVYAAFNKDGALIDGALAAGDSGGQALTTWLSENLITAVVADNAELSEALLLDGANCDAATAGRSLLNYANDRGFADLAALLETHECPDWVEESACREEERLFVNRACVDCPEGQILHQTANRCEPNYTACHDNDQIYDSAIGGCRDCLDDGTEKRYNNECVPLPECTGERVRAANGFTCECPVGKYWHTDKCVPQCPGECSALNDDRDGCKCPDGFTPQADGSCIPSCPHVGQVWDSANGCQCPTGQVLNSHINECHVPVVPCPGGKVPNETETACVCPTNLPHEHSGACNRCPQGQVWRGVRGYDHRGNPTTTNYACRARSSGGNNNGCGSDPSCRGNRR